jgi:5-methyltetrahydropteroyltriglutamate--homocysteine methyltransferase
MLFPTTLVGSYPQPDWLIDRPRLAGRFPPRVRARELWRVAEPWLREAQDDATLLAIRAQEAAGLDIITDGEIRRERYSNRFATALDGVDVDNPGTALDRSGHPNPVPRIVGPVRRRHPVEVEDVRFLRAHTTKPIKMTVPGPFTMSQQAQNDYYPTEEAAAMDYAAAVNEGDPDPFAAGADVVQVDEPPCRRGRKARRTACAFRARPRARAARPRSTSASATPRSSTSAPGLLVPAGARGCSCQQVSIETAQSGLDCAVLTSLPDQRIMLGCLDLSDPAVETPETVVRRVRRALDHVAADRLVLAPDCGMKYLPREVAFGKMQAMVAAARILRSELAREAR